MALRHREAVAIATLTDELEWGWRWLETHPTHPKHTDFTERWVG